MKKEYDVPSTPPVYKQATEIARPRRRFFLFALVDGVMIALALICTFWLAYLMLGSANRISLWMIVHFVIFWSLVAYFGLPRLHQIITLIYIPDYFIGRTRTSDGLLGDPVNLALDGTSEDIHASMQRAGWRLADEITIKSTWDIVISSIFGRSYPHAPVSGLYLFGKRHAFCYQQEVEGNPAQRHHIRFWPTPKGWMLPGGEKAQWMAAGTYDRAVGFSLFTGQITHKIDANTDAERDYVIETLRYADKKISVRVIKDFSTAYHHRNGGGDTIYTDGNMPIVHTNGAAERATEPIEVPQKKVAGRLPPPSLLFVGLLLVTQLILIVFGLFVALSATSGSVASGDIANELFFYLFIDISLLGLWVAVLARRRWARAILMTVLGVIAVSDLAQTHTGQGFGSVIIASISVLIILAITSGASRDWAAGSRRDIELKIDR